MLSLRIAKYESCHGATIVRPQYLNMLQLRIVSGFGQPESRGTLDVHRMAGTMLIDVTSEIGTVSTSVA